MKTQWIPANEAEPIVEAEETGSFYFDAWGRERVHEYLGGNFEFVQVCDDGGKPMYMLVNEIGSLLYLPINPRATDIYHNAVVKKQCEKQGVLYIPSNYAQIHGPAILCMERMT